MARQLRVEYPGAFYHVISRGERLENIFFHDSDRFKFLEKLEETVNKFNLKIHCYVLMSNHFHLLLETPEGNLSKAMHFLNTSYANWFKSKHQIVGSLFQGRYKSILVEKEAYLLALSAYIHLNPVRAGLVCRPDEYTWSSFKGYIKRANLNCWLFTSDVLNTFSDDREEYKKFVYYQMSKENKGRKEEFFGKDSILGKEKFRNEIKKIIKLEKKENNIREKPDLKHLNKMTTNDIKNIILNSFHVKEEELFSKKKNNDYRKLFLYGMRKYTQLSLKEIGELCEMDYVAVFQMIKRFVSDSMSNSRLKKKLERFDREILNKMETEC
jgi:REP element-mobilizing transposase RayT